MSNSPMAKPVSLQPFNLKKHKSFSALALPLNKVSATEQLTAVFQKHQQRELEQYARNGAAKREGSVSSSASALSTPALSYYSNATSASNDSAEETDYSINDLDEDSSDGLSYPPSHAAPTSLSPPSQTQTRHSEFGHCTNEAFRYVSAYRGPSEEKETVEQEPPMDVLLNTYMSYLILIILGHLRDFFGKVFFPESYAHLKPSNGYAALNSDFDNFFTRRMKKRIDDCFSRPVTGVPGRTISLLDRQSEDFNETYTYTGGKTRALNVSSYNYLGFAQARGGCADAVEESLRRYGISSLGPRLEGGTSDLHIAAEALVARFMGTEDALITSMGFATNSTNIPALVSKGSLVISDELNHASIRLGVRMSGASVRMFKHNDMKDLERLLREVISQGQPRTHRPWKKILIIVEGLYSMEGTMCNLPGILELKERYKFYLFIDEAHSIGALGPHGRGVTDYFSIPPTSIDLLMGTFTKSFGAAGGYIAGSKAMISRLRLRSHSATYAESITPSVLTQIVASMGSIMGVVPDGLPSSALSTPTPTTSDDSKAMVPYTPGPAPASLIPPWLSLPPSLLSGAEGTLRLRRLAFNCRYLARGLRKLGFMSSSHPSSPIVPLLLFHPGKMPSFSRMMLQRKTPIVVVVVGYPATPLTSARVRFCLSASHTKEDVDLVLEACDELGDYLDLKRGAGKGERWSLEEIKRRAVELVEM